MLGQEHPDTLTSVNNLALLYQAQGRYGEAEPLYRRALEARERVLGPEHPETLTSVNNLALLYRAQGRYGEAEPLLQARARGQGARARARSIPIRFKREQSGAALSSPGPLRRGRAALSGARWQAYERVLGPEHPDTLTSVNNLAALYQAQGRYAEAEPLYQARARGRERVLGPEHPDTLQSVNNLAAALSRPGPLRRGRAALISARCAGP